MKPLEGIKILDFTQFFAGPLCTMLLQDMGADVIKLENPPYGDGTRYSPSTRNEKSTNYTSRNRGKKSVLMNLKDERQVAIFLEMVKTADVVIENFKPGTLEKYGITYEKMKELNPAIVYTSISGYGQTGPYKSHAAFDGAVQAESGLMSITGEADGRPLRCGASIADATAGLIGAIGTLGALMGAKMTGQGRRVDVSMMDSIACILENSISSFLEGGPMQTRSGNGLWTASPFNSFECKDGQSIYLGISTDAQFAKFCGILGKEEWLEDERFATNIHRVSNKAVLEPMVEEVLKEKFTLDELCEALEKERLVFGRINDIAQLVQHPQILARNMIVNAVYPDGDTFKVPGAPIKMSDMEDETEYRTVTVGYDTIEVLSQYVDEAKVHEIYDDVIKETAAAVAKKYS